MGQFRLIRRQARTSLLPTPSLVCALFSTYIKTRSTSHWCCVSDCGIEGPSGEALHGEAPPLVALAAAGSRSPPCGHSGTCSLSPCMLCAYQMTLCRIVQIVANQDRSSSWAPWKHPTLIPHFFSSMYS